MRKRISQAKTQREPQCLVLSKLVEGQPQERDRMMSMEAGREARPCRTSQGAAGQATHIRAWNVIRLMFVEISGHCCCCVRSQG